jgi:uncharacterized protein YecE (DUF72 family)
VQAETTAEVAVIPGSVYRKLFESERTIQNLTVQALSALVYRLMAELEQVHASNHRQRLGQFILTHASAEGLLRMTQQQIARHLGTTREVIARLQEVGCPVVMGNTDASLLATQPDEGATPAVVTGRLVYVRLRKTSYAAEELEAWRVRVRGWVAEGIDVYAYIKHEENPDAPRIAVEFSRGLTENP